VAQAPWSHTARLKQVCERVLPIIPPEEPAQALIVDDTRHPKERKHPVGVVRQYCSERGRQDNCQVAVSLSVATHQAGLLVGLSALPAAEMGRRCRAACQGERA